MPSVHLAVDLGRQGASLPSVPQALYGELCLATRSRPEVARNLRHGHGVYSSVILWLKIFVHKHSRVLHYGVRDIL